MMFVLEIVKLAKGEHDSQLSRMTQCEQDTYEMHVRAANIVRAGESLMKLVSDIKQYLILNDFPSVNEAITQNSKLFRYLCDYKWCTTVILSLFIAFGAQKSIRMWQLFSMNRFLRKLLYVYFLCF